MNKKLENKKILILGGTLISCEIIKKAQEMGIFVGVADYNDLENSPGKRIADKDYMVSATDADVLLPYYSMICEKTGLPCYGTLEQFEIFTDKDKYKQLLRQYDIPTVKEYVVDLNNVEESIDISDYPVMVKPADSSGARGITVCYDSKELKDALKKATSFSKQCSSSTHNPFSFNI